MGADLYRKYLIILLMVLLASNYMDRMVLGLLLQDIKTDLELSDTQLGLLSGFAFATFYALAGVAVARWADRGNRRVVVALSTLIWSIAVALCGLAGGFYQLLVTRMAVATGEAGLKPPAYSLIADYFGRAERPKAVAIFNLGAPLAVVLAYMLGGWLNELYGWRATFILIGLPGAGLAGLAWLTLREPRTEAVAVRPGDSAGGGGDRAENPVEAAPALGEIWKYLWKSAAFRHLLLAHALLVFFSEGLAKWVPAFFIRSYGMATDELGLWLAFIIGVPMLLGLPLGGMLASRYAASNETLQLKAVAVAYCCFGIIYAASFWPRSGFSHSR